MDLPENADNIINQISDEIPDSDSPAVDSIIHVSIDKKELTAFINIESPRNGGSAPSLEALKKALAENSITTNVDSEMLDALALVPIFESDIVVARGTAPINGADGTYTLLFDAEKQNTNFNENSDGIVDFYDLNIVENVSKGQILAQITLPTEGVPGISVKGRNLLQKQGKPVPSISGKNTELSEDGTAIIALIDGPVEFKGNRICVDEVFSIEGDIDIKTGNIKVASSLSVLGMVLPGYKIEAGENISVRGTVESALIKAGGNIKLQSGITGSELECDGDLTCCFIENSNIVVKGNITAEYILNSNIKCGKSIITTGKISKIIGGNCSAGGNIETKTIGSISNVKTKMELIINCCVIERRDELKSKIPELEKHIDSLKKIISVLRRLAINNQLSPEKKEILENATYNYYTDTKSLDEIKKELDEIDESINSMGNSKIVCKGTIYPGTTVVMGSSNLFITEPLNNTAIYCKDGRIHKGMAH